MASSRHLVDPELGPLLDVLPPLELSMETLPAARELSLSLPDDGAGLGQVTVDRHNIPGPPDAPDVEIFVYRPNAPIGPMSCLLHIHGGGYVSGEASRLGSIHRGQAAAVGCVVVSVNYRLAPETRAPGSVEDCYAALAWIFANAADLGVDLKRVGVTGESAGGGLAAALALLARDRGEYPLAFQHLIYPMLDDRTVAHPDPHPYAGEFLWTPHNNRFGWEALLGVEPGSDGVSPYAAPARAETLAGLPSTFISTGSLDLFLEENIEYARRLLRDGVPTEFHIYPGGFHAFDIAPEAQVSKTARRDSRAALARFLK